MNKYCIALRPTTKAAEIISLAQAFSIFAQGYLLGEQALPHLSLLHFLMAPKDIEAVMQKLAPLKCQKLKLAFKKIEMYNYKDNHWVSLIPEVNAELMALQVEVSTYVKSAVYRFDPHITLIKAANDNLPALIQKVDLQKINLNDVFTLALGRLDGVGQLIEVID